jgi:hypothetical protein
MVVSHPREVASRWHHTVSSNKESYKFVFYVIPSKPDITGNTKVETMFVLLIPIGKQPFLNGSF